MHYRDSKLTQLLKDSLGGNARSTLVATVTASPLCISETISTLRFASRAKLVKTRATVNQLMEASDKSQLQDEIRRLQERISVYEKMGADANSDSPLPVCKFEFSLLKSMQAKLEHVEYQQARAAATIGNWKLSNAQKDRQISREKMISKLRDSEVERLKGLCESKNVDPGFGELQVSLDKAHAMLSQPEADSLSIAVQLKSLRDQYDEIDLSNSFASPDMDQLQKEWIEKLSQFEDERETLEKRISLLECGEAHVLLSNQLATIKAEKKTLEYRLEKSLDERISLDSDNQDYQEQISQLTSMLRDRDSDVALLSAEKNALEAELASRQTDENKAPGLEQLLEKANSEIADLKGRVETALLSAGDASRGEKKARRESDVADYQRNALRKEAAELQEQNRTLSQDATDLQDKLAILEESVETSKIQQQLVSNQVLS